VDEEVGEKQTNAITPPRPLLSFASTSCPSPTAHTQRNKQMKFKSPHQKKKKKKEKKEGIKGE